MTFRKAIALILVLAIMAAGGYYLLKVEREDDDRMRSLYTEVEPLERERETLLQERAQLETDFALKSRDYGTLEILFTSLDAQIATDVWPVMRERGVVGMLCVNFKESPVYYNKLTADDMAKLVADGWSTCLYVDAPFGSTFQYWFDQFSQYCTMYKIPLPTTAYFTNDTYDESMLPDIVEAGITTVIFDTTNARGGMVTDFNANPWVTYAMPFGYTGSATDLELLGRTDGGNLVMTMKLNEIWDKSKNKNVESKERQAFIDTLDSWKELLYEDDPLADMDTVGPTPYIYVDTTDPEVLHEIYLDTLTPEQQLLLPKIRSVSAETALSLHRDAAGQVAELEAEKDKREREIDSRLSVLDLEIRETYDRYGMTRTEEPQQTP